MNIKEISLSGIKEVFRGLGDKLPKVPRLPLIIGAALVILALAAGGAYWFFFMGDDTVAASKYAETVYSNVFTQWNTQKLMENIGPTYLAKLAKPGEKDKLMQLFKAGSEGLGKLKKHTVVSAKQGKDATGAFVEFSAKDSFEKGDANIRLRVFGKDGKWKVSDLQITSTVLTASWQPGAPVAAKPANEALPKGGIDNKSKEVKPEEKKTVDVPVVAYEYNAKGRRDPFVPLIVKAEPEKKKGLKPIENYAVTEFKLVAILWNSAGYYAVITLPDGKSYTVREGMTLGLYGGKVYKMKADSVIIREQIKDYRGVPASKDTILKLRKEEGE